MHMQHTASFAFWGAMLMLASLADGQEKISLRSDLLLPQTNNPAPEVLPAALPSLWMPSRHGPTGKSSFDTPLVNVGLSRVPKLGFRSTFGGVGGAKGELIRQVQLGSPADRMKLLPGDAIVAVNGAPLVDANSWHDAISRALARDGWVTLKIRAARSGAVEYRTVNLMKLPAKW